MARPVGVAVKPIGTPAEGAAGTVVTRTAGARAQKVKLGHDVLLNSDSVHDIFVGKPGDAATVPTRLRAKKAIIDAMAN